MKAVATLLPLIFAGCVAKVPSAVPSYLAGSYQEAIEKQSRFAEKNDRNTALQNVRLAAMALAVGDNALADKAFVRATKIMQDFGPDGSFKAMMGQEQQKDWKGAPYEKIWAFLYLALLRYDAREYGNASAMAKSAQLADAGTRIEGYQGDVVAAHLLRALVERTRHSSREAHRLAEEAANRFVGRHLAHWLAKQVPAAVQASHVAHAEVAGDALLAAIPRAVEESPRDAARAARLAVSVASEMLRMSAGLPPQKRPPELEPHDRFELRDAIVPLGAVGEALKALASYPPPYLRHLAEVADKIVERVDNATLFVITERGVGPTKTTRGEYNEELVIKRGHQPDDPPQLALNGAPISSAQIESTTFQATTRGGRRVDAYLEGKAIFKQSSLVSGVVMLSAARIAMRENTAVGGIMALAGLIAVAASAATHPQADTRAWEMLPEAWWLSAETVAPGRYILSYHGRDCVVQVASDAPALVLLPVYAPYDPLGCEPIETGVAP